MNPSDAVSAILPVRNEETAVERAVVSLAAQPEIRQILVVNDQSTDGTARVLAQLAAREPKLQLLDAGPLPAGWVGKNHAAWQGAQRARERWLLFTDADAVHLPGSAGRALADAAATGAAMISYSPAQEMHTWWERSLIPFIFCRLSELYSYAAVNNPQSPAAAANGQYLLVRRDAYDAIEAALVLQLRRLSPQIGRLEDAPAEIVALLANPGRLASMSAAARTQAHPAAAERIADRLAALATESAVQTQ